jgi:hypothetical protein
MLRNRHAATGIILLSIMLRPVSAQTTAPATICDDPTLLVQTKAALAAGHGPQEALARLTAEADALLKHKPASVTDKPRPGPSGDKHDYVSYAPYYWPNPATPNGLPFIRKDGYRNVKQVNQGDAPAYERTLGNIHVLGLAYWYTGNDAYATQAALLLRTWFLDPATRMNPNFQYAQAVLGSNDGRGTGLIESRGILGLLDALTLINASPAWTAADAKAMRSWLQEFDTWMTTSKEGLAEKAAPNNHGSWYAVLQTGLYLYLDQPQQAREVLEAIKLRIPNQIEPDGRQPMEIKRQDGYSYSVFNLRALTTLADIAQRQGIDLWKFEKDGRTIKKAVDYLLPFASGDQPWKDKQLKKITPGSLVPIVARAAQIYGDKTYTEWLAAHKDTHTASTDILTGDP